MEIENKTDTPKSKPVNNRSNSFWNIKVLVFAVIAFVTLVLIVGAAAVASATLNAKNGNSNGDDNRADQRETPTPTLEPTNSPTGSPFVPVTLEIENILSLPLAQEFFQYFCEELKIGDFKICAINNPFFCFDNTFLRLSANDVCDNLMRERCYCDDGVFQPFIPPELYP